MAAQSRAVPPAESRQKSEQGNEVAPAPSDSGGGRVGEISSQLSLVCIRAGHVIGAMAANCCVSIFNSRPEVLLGLVFVTHLQARLKWTRAERTWHMLHVDHV